MAVQRQQTTREFCPQATNSFEPLFLHRHGSRHGSRYGPAAGTAVYAASGSLKRWRFRPCPVAIMHASWLREASQQFFDFSSPRACSVLTSTFFGVSGRDRGGTTNREGERE